VTKLAREYGVSYIRLCARIAGKDSKSTRKPTNQRLDPAQYSALYEYLDQLDDIGASPSATLVRNAANAILERAILILLTHHQKSQQTGRIASSGRQIVI
jgi:hypothetical protein